jgi:hypothetical protein
VPISSTSQTTFADALRLRWKQRRQPTLDQTSPRRPDRTPPTPTHHIKHLIAARKERKRGNLISKMDACMQRDRLSVTSPLRKDQVYVVKAKNRPMFHVPVALAIVFDSRKPDRRQPGSRGTSGSPTGGLAEIGLIGLVIEKWEDFTTCQPRCSPQRRRLASDFTCLSDFRRSTWQSRDTKGRESRRGANAACAVVEAAEGIEEAPEAVKGASGSPTSRHSVQRGSAQNAAAGGLHMAPFSGTGEMGGVDQAHDIPSLKKTDVSARADSTVCTLISTKVRNLLIIAF